MNVAVVTCADDPRIELSGDVTTVSGLCESPALLAEEVGRADRIVLLLHERRYDLASVQKALRSMEVDPLGVQILEVAPDRPGEGIPLTVAGLEARAAAFRRSEPENAKPELRGDVTRRGLFQILQPFLPRGIIFLHI